jgi:hypothetical protein
LLKLSLLSLSFLIIASLASFFDKALSVAFLALTLLASLKTLLVSLKTLLASLKRLKSLKKSFAKN